MNKLYFGDNFKILREVFENRVYLIYMDPPFNSWLQGSSLMFIGIKYYKRYPVDLQVTTWVKIEVSFDAYRLKRVSTEPETS